MSVFSPLTLLLRNKFYPFLNSFDMVLECYNVVLLHEQNFSLHLLWWKSFTSSSFIIYTYIQCFFYVRSRAILACRYFVQENTGACTYEVAIKRTVVNRAHTANILKRFITILYLNFGEECKMGQEGTNSWIASFYHYYLFQVFLLFLVYILAE